MAGAALLALIGAWLVMQATAGRLPARLLSYRSAPIGAAAPTTAAPTGDGSIAGQVAGVITGTWVRPAPGGITGTFGEPRGDHVHEGVDIACSIGTPVVAANGGTVTRTAGPAESGGYGNVIYISHPGGIETRYAHLASIDVRTGQYVAAGQRIAASGNTGDSSGPHLHFEVRANGTPVNPGNYVAGL